MNKRGQMFVVIAFIICFILFTVITPYNTVRETVALQDFDELTENYKNEEPKVINKAIAEGEEPGQIKENVKDFTEKFIDFAQTKDPNFGILYIVKDAEGNYIIKNYLNEQLIKVTAQAAGQTTPEVYVTSNNDQRRGVIGLEGLGDIGTSANAEDFDQQNNEVNLGKLGGYDKLVITVGGIEYTYELTKFNDDKSYILRSTSEIGPDEVASAECSSNVPCY